MKNEFDFIKNKIDELIEISGISEIKYEYRPSSYTHFIEIIPQSVYENESGLLKIEADIIEEFNDTFYDSTLCFLGEDSLIKLKCPTYSKTQLKQSSFISIPEFPMGIELFQGYDFSLPRINMLYPEVNKFGVQETSSGFFVFSMKENMEKVSIQDVDPSNNLLAA